MSTSEQSVEAFVNQVQSSLINLKSLEATVDQAYGQFCSTEKQSVAALGQGKPSDDAKELASPRQVLHALEGLFRTLVEVGFLAKVTGAQVQMLPKAPDSSSLQYGLEELKENLQGQAKEADVQSLAAHECYQRMKAQISEQRARADQLVADAKGLMEMRMKAEELEAQAQQLRHSYENACRNYEVVQQKQNSLETEKRGLEEELSRQPLEPYIIA